MGNKSIVVSYEEIERASKELKEISTEYTKIYTKLLKNVGTMGNAWKGPDNTAYVEQLTEFSENLQAMADKLDQAGEMLKQQVKNYENHQDSNRSKIKQLPGN